MEELERVRRAIAGDPTAERELYDAHVERVYRLAYRISGDPDRAEDDTQETFVRAFDRLASFRGEAAFSTWLHAIAVSVVMNGLRKRRRRDQHEVDWEEVAELPDRETCPNLELRRKLECAIDQLSETLRIPFVMHCIEGYKHHEIAETLGVPEGTSKARVFQARQRLLDQLKGDATPSNQVVWRTEP